MGYRLASESERLARAKIQKMKTEFDPELKKAMLEVQDILRKYDCAASIILISPTHSEFLYHVETSWSVMKMEGPGYIRFKSKKDDFATKADQHAATEASVHMLTTFLQFGRKSASIFGGLIEQLGHHMKIAYEVWDK